MAENGWRIALTVGYAVAVGALVAAENFDPGLSETPILILIALSPVVGFIVGRWWVVLAFLGPLVGGVIGYDPGANDGNPALWWPYLLSDLLVLGGPLAFGVLASDAWRRRQGHRRHQR